MKCEWGYWDVQVIERNPTRKVWNGLFEAFPTFPMIAEAMDIQAGDMLEIAEQLKTQIELAITYKKIANDIVLEEWHDGAEGYNCDCRVVGAYTFTLSRRGIWK